MGMRAIALHQQDVSVIWGLCFPFFPFKRMAKALLSPCCAWLLKQCSQQAPPALRLMAPILIRMTSKLISLFLTGEQGWAPTDSAKASQALQAFCSGKTTQTVSGFLGFVVLLALLFSVWGNEWVFNCQLCRVPHQSFLNENLIWSS